ncbi:hypothetical protein HaLaN_18793 [Haematococcus lacustris]|uniref:Uncharacterized protein n=1 Tax=Haematococcus lacustris TaxID=44745 RepID=A0A699ZPB4_HAELA|nr:hypothetical protein HaLaN_18793 [Haematococcus lacustris]
MEGSSGKRHGRILRQAAWKYSVNDCPHARTANPVAVPPCRGGGGRQEGLDGRTQGHGESMEDDLGGGAAPPPAAASLEGLPAAAATATSAQSAVAQSAVAPAVAQQPTAALPAAPCAEAHPAGGPASVAEVLASAEATGTNAQQSAAAVTLPTRDAVDLPGRGFTLELGAREQAGKQQRSLRGSAWRQNTSRAGGQPPGK